MATNDLKDYFEEDKVEYSEEIKKVNLNLVNLKYDIGSVFSFLDYHTDQTFKISTNTKKATIYSLIRRIEINNETDFEFHKVEISFQFNNPIFKNFVLVHDVVKGNLVNQVEFEDVLVIDGTKLYSQRGRDVCQLELELRDVETGTILDRKLHRFLVLPIRQSSEERIKGYLMLSKYCFTEFPELISVQHDAVAENNNEPIIAYQNSTDQKIYEEIDSIYRALHKKAIIYSNPPHSIGSGVQEVRLPSDVLQVHQGTCLDISILFCSTLLQVGYHPILVLVDGHALVGVFLNEGDTFKGYELRDKSELLEISLTSQRRVLLINAVSIEASSDCNFKTAKTIGEEYIKNTTTLRAIDVYACQQFGPYSPIPIPQDTGKIDIHYEPKPISQSTIDENEVYIAHHIEGSMEKDRFYTWERKLLDLQTRNKLINFSYGGKDKKFWSSCIPLGANSETVFKMLKEKNSLRVNTIEKLDKESTSINYDQFTLLAQESLEAGTILACTNKNLFNMVNKKNKEAIEETGSSTLYLAIGDLAFLDAKKVIHGPMLLLPIQMEYKGYDSQFEMTYDLDDLIVNQTFFEYVKLKKNLDYEQVYLFDYEQQKIEDLVESINVLNNGAVHASTNNNIISNFTFNHYVMWKDIHTRKEDLIKNKVVESFVKNESMIEPDDFFEGKTSDSLDVMGEFAAPLPYDSTQLKAIIECGRGKSFVLDGPPGTGKSQTIVNMIVNAMYQNKTVLFVAEKAAALDVVRSRLTRLKLDRFMMPLYGNALNKTMFFEQFRRAVNAVGLEDNSNYQATIEQISKEKNEILKELNHIHQKDEKQGEIYSLYDAIINFKATQDYKNLFKITPQFILSYSYAKDNLVRGCINKYVSLLDRIQDYSKSPLRYMSFKEYTFVQQEKILETFRKLEQKLGAFEDAVKKLIGEYIDFSTLSFENIQSIVSIIHTLYTKRIEKEKLDDESYYIKENDTLFSIVTKIEELSAGHSIEALFLVGKNYDFLLETLNKKVNLFNKKSINTSLKEELGKTYQQSDILEEDKAILLQIVSLLKEEETSLKKATTTLTKFFNKDFLTSKEDYLESKEVYLATKFVHDELNLLSFSIQNKEAFMKMYGFFTMVTKMQLNLFSEQIQLAKEYIDEVQSIFLEMNLVSPTNLKGLKVQTFEGGMKPFIQELSNEKSTTTLAQIAQVNEYKETLINNDLGGLLDVIQRDDVDYHHLEDVYENALSYGYILKYYMNDEKADYFNRFSSTEYEEHINSYIDGISKYNNLCLDDLKVRIQKAIKGIEYQKRCPGNIGELNKLASVSGRGTTIRNALSRYEDYFRTYFPCFLMSPSAAASLLSTDATKFDIVIFDEASQIPTAEAIGPVSRGKSLVVAGDPKQMPPSNYFAASLNGEEKEEDIRYLDSESFLDECIAIGLPSFHLSFHYRSKHESLIQFSNKNFYDGGLYTFPSSDYLKCHVELKYNGIQKKESKLTKEEQDNLMKIFKETALNPLNEGKSIGVIVFNTVQQDVISEAIENLVNTSEQMKNALQKAPEPYFVKNLENVQGDERDIIILSISFGNENGKAHPAGPLILEKGERRLNVAASRAKERMIIVSNIKSSEIDASKSKNAGAAHLKDLLYFAENASMNSVNLNNNRPNEIASFIKKDLEKYEDIESDLYIGSSSFKVDIALRPANQEEYVLGILLDEKPLNSVTSCRDRFFVQNTILKSLNWKIIRIYSVQYHRHPQNTIDYIIEEFNKAKAAYLESKTAMREEPEVVPVFNTTMVFDSYKTYTTRTRFSFEYVEKNTYSKDYEKELEALIKMEAPVSFDRIVEFSKMVFDKISAGERMRDYFAKHLKKKEYQTTKDYKDKTFYWYCNAKNQTTFFRKSNRDITEIPKEELLFLINNTMKKFVKLTKEDLIKEICRILGVSAGRIIRDKIIYTLDYGKEKSLLVADFEEFV